MSALERTRNFWDRDACDAFGTLAGGADRRGVGLAAVCLAILVLIGSGGLAQHTLLASFRCDLHNIPDV